jgi:hypothetical protein
MPRARIVLNNEQLYVTMAVIGFLFAACKRSSQQDPSRRHTVEPAPVAQTGDSITLRTLVDSLVRLPGDFLTWNQGRWEFTGDGNVLMAFESFGDKAVIALANCLDKGTPAKATARGRTVLEGVMCYWALRHLAYYEGDLDPESPRNWAGEIEPIATAPELSAAKEAWLTIIREHKYHLT